MLTYIKRHQIVKRCLILVLRGILRAFYIFPVKKNRILFSSYEGGQYACSPKYIFEVLYRELGASCEYVWGINDKSLIPNSYRVIYTKYLSIKFIFYSLTAKIIINNLGIEPILPKRKSQIFINTWHGGGGYKKGKPNKKYLRELRSMMTNYVISSCSKFSEIVSLGSFLDIDKNKVLPIGMPRNDIFFQEQRHTEIRNRICQMYGIDKKQMLVLYAPTCRGTHHEMKGFSGIICRNDVCDAVKERFGKEAVFLYRAHQETSIAISGGIDVSNYFDMQELLVATDILITDYSSSIWDFSFTYRPGFLYTPDLEEYESSTNFYTPISQWQYPYALTMEELCANIRNYDETVAIERIKAHHALLGSYEKGTATEQVCTVIKQYLP